MADLPGKGGIPIEHSGWTVAIALLAVVVFLFILFVITRPCSSPSCGCGSARQPLIASG